MFRPSKTDNKQTDQEKAAVEQAVHVGVTTVVKVGSLVTGIPALSLLAVDLASSHSLVWGVIQSLFSW